MSDNELEKGANEVKLENLSDSLKEIQAKLGEFTVNQLKENMKVWQRDSDMSSKLGRNSTALFCLGGLFIGTQIIDICLRSLKSTPQKEIVVKVDPSKDVSVPTPKEPLADMDVVAMDPEQTEKIRKLEDKVKELEEGRFKFRDEVLEIMKKHATTEELENRLSALETKGEWDIEELKQTNGLRK